VHVTYTIEFQRK